MARSKRTPITRLTNTSNGPRKIPKTLKRERTRQIIRRFHVLLKERSEIIEELAKQKRSAINESNYVKLAIETDLTLKKVYEQAYQRAMAEVKLNSAAKSERVVLKKDSTALARKLGEIDGEISKRGGLKVYQAASIKGQDQKRGGDSSKKMVGWLDDLGIWQKASKAPTALEIGSLSSKNHISTCKIFGQVTRIDLNSQEPKTIIQQDFLKRPLPKSNKDKFDMISCSLVLNFVPKPELRGKMLKRICQFLKEPEDAIDGQSLLFFVLPLPCVENSRYCDTPTFDAIMKNLGFSPIKYQESHKLAYWLYKWAGSTAVNEEFEIKKKELRKGSKRNNFCVVIKN